MDQLLFNDNEPLFSLFEETNSGSSSNEYTPPHEPQIFNSFNTYPITNELVPNSYTLDISNLYKNEPLRTEKIEEKIVSTKSKRKRETVKDLDLEKFSKKPEFNSPEEEKEWKKQRRMIRNRLSAQASREKKRDQLDYFQQANEVLQKNNEELQKKVKELTNINDTLSKENSLLKSKLKLYEAPNQQQQLKQTWTSNQNQTSTGKKSVMIFMFIFFVGFFFIPWNSKPNIQLNHLTNNVGRVLLSNVENKPVHKETIKVKTEPIEMKKEQILYQSEMKNLFGGLFKNETKDLVKRDIDTEKEIKPKLEKGFIFHYENNQEDTIYFMCPKLYPLFPVSSTTTKKKMLNMTFLIPVDYHHENDKTIVKLSKFQAKEIEKSEAFLNL